MKRYGGLFLLAVCFAACVQAQHIKWSAPLADDKKMPYLKILGADENGYYLLRSNVSFENEHSRSKSKKYELQYYSNALAVRWVQPLAAPCEDCRIADIELAGSTVLVLSSQFDKKQKQLRSFVQKLDGGGKATAEPLLLMTLNAEKVDDNNPPDLIISHDERLISCAYRSVQKDRDVEINTVVAFDTSLTIIYKKEMVTALKNESFSPINTVLTDDGNFMVLGKLTSGMEKKQKLREASYKLFSYNHKRDTVESNEVKLANKFLTDLALSADNLNKRIVVAGFYSDQTTYSVAGVFYYSLTEESLKATPIVTSSFSPEFLRKFPAERQENGKELTNYAIHRIVLRKDGGAALIAESFYTSTQSYWDYFLQSWVYHYYYHYGNIMSLSINPDGSLLWSNVITKDQNSTDDGGYYSSFLPAIVGGKFIAVYNKFLTSPSSVLMTVINGTGAQITKTLFPESENITILPRSAKQVDEATILVPALRDDKPCLSKISFE